MGKFLPKDYVGVHTRVEQYHKDHTGDMSIDTEFTLSGDVACFKAIVKTSKGVFSGSSFGRVGEEKAFEKLETVAVGRALAFAGYEVQSGIASREEMEEFEKKLSPSDEIIEQMRVCEDIEQLKGYFAELTKLSKSEKQMAFFTKVKDQEKKRIEAKNVHTS